MRTILKASQGTEESSDDISCRLNGGITTNSAKNGLVLRGYPSAEMAPSIALKIMIVPTWCIEKLMRTITKDLYGKGVSFDDVSCWLNGGIATNSANRE